MNSVQMQSDYDKIYDYFSSPNIAFSGLIVKDKTGKQSVHCKYRLNYDPKDATRCPIGVLIPDNRYDPEIDKCGYSVSVVFYRLGRKINDNKELEFYESIQKAHDTWTAEMFKTGVSSINSFLGDIRTLAKAYGLNPNR